MMVSFLHPPPLRGGGEREGERVFQMKGILGKLLDIDLTSGKTKEIGIPDETAKKYLGGRGLGARLLFDLLPAKTEPLSPENILIFLTGPFTGSMTPGYQWVVRQLFQRQDLARDQKGGLRRSRDSGKIEPPLLPPA
jgi:hypothetical protein